MCVSQPASQQLSHSAIQPVSGPPERGEARAGGSKREVAYLGRLRLDFTGTSEGSVDFTHDCGLWVWFAVLVRCLVVRGGSWSLVVAAGESVLATVEREEKQSRTGRAGQSRTGQSKAADLPTWSSGVVVSGFSVVEWNDCAGVRFRSVWVPRRGDWLSAAFSRIVTLFSCVEGWNPMPAGVCMYLHICYLRGVEQYIIK